MTLTLAQFETVDELFRRLDQSSETFDAYAIFPSRNNQDNGHRRTLISLARRGLIVRFGSTDKYRIPSWRALLDADQEYRRKYNVWD